MHEFHTLLPNGIQTTLKGNLLVPQINGPTILYGEKAEIVAIIPAIVPIWRASAVPAVTEKCNDNCAINFCDEYGCINRNKTLTETTTDK